jgi:hypothetical protein
MHAAVSEDGLVLYQIAGGRDGVGRSLLAAGNHIDEGLDEVLLGSGLGLRWSGERGRSGGQ